MTPLYFAFPLAFLLLPLAGILFFLTKSSAARLAPRWQQVALGLRCAVFLCLVLALSDPQWTRLSNEKHVIWAVDVSNSVGTRAMEAAASFAEETGLAEADQSWIVFAENPLPVGSPQLEWDGLDATNLSRALQFSSAMFPIGKQRILVVFSDGVQTTGDARAGFDFLAESATRIFPVPIEPSDSPEVLIKSLEAPSRVSANEPFEVRAIIASNTPGTVELDVFQDGLKAGTREIEIDKGETPISITQRAAGGRAVEISLSLASDNDTWQENNRASTLVLASGEARVLLLSENPSSELASALQPQGIAVEIRSTAGMPEDPAAMQNFDAVILDQVPADRFSQAQMTTLRRFVRDSGGGLLMLGGPDSFGEGGYAETPVGELLPLMSEFEKQMEIPSLAIVPVIDRSGSMTGDKMRMAKSAAAAAVQLLSPQDFAGVVVFDTEANWSPTITAASNTQEILAAIGTIEAGGGTNMSAGLELALQALRVTPARLKHVILLSDGISIPGTHEELAAQMAAENISLSTVAVGSDADEVLLERMARVGNGRYYFTDSPESIPRIFARETLMASRPGIWEEPFTANVVRQAPFLAGIDFDTAPFLLGHTITRPRPGAEVWLETETGAPLLATWRAGLGKVAAFSSDARNVWASEWLGWESFGSFWAQVLREIMRPQELKNFPVSFQSDRDGFRLLLEATDPSGAAIADASATAIVTGPDGIRHELALTTAGPGLLETRWDAAQAGTYHAAIQLEAPGLPAQTQTAGTITPYPKEFLFQPADLQLLKDLAKATGGKLSPTPAEIRNATSEPRPTQNELWPWFAAGALLFWLADVAVRKRTRMAFQSVSP